MACVSFVKKLIYNYWIVAQGFSGRAVYSTLANDVVACALLLIFW